MREDVLGYGLLVRETLQQDDHLSLTHGVHTFGRHVPTLPVDVWGLRRQG